MLMMNVDINQIELYIYILTEITTTHYILYEN